MLFADIPACFVEDFCNIKSKAQSAYPKTSKVIFSANAWYGEEAFKQWAATAAENGTLLIGTAHGGAYGGWADFPSENHETSIADLYYSWGWERADCVAKIVPFPATKLAGRKKIGASNQKMGILWAATQGKRYLAQLPYLPKYFQEYLAWQGRFAKSLNPEILPAVRFRPHREDNGWDVIQRLNKCIPGLTIEAWNVSFQKSLVNCRLYVCDHMSTTYTEALAANKPTVLFWNSHTNKLRPEALPYYDLLRKSGILFDTPESAGEAVNHIYDDVETWWNNPERQNAIEIFCERFARNSPDALELWASEFNKIASISTPQRYSS
jgi:putative transferase (TIGR04331 family)